MSPLQLKLNPYQLKLNNEPIYPITGLEAVIDADGNNIPLILNKHKLDLLDYAKNEANTAESNANINAGNLVRAEAQRAGTVEGTLDTRIEKLEDLIAKDHDGVINKFLEIVKFLNGISDTESLDRILGDIATRFNLDENKITALYRGINLSITVLPTVIYKGTNTNVTATGKLQTTDGSINANLFLINKESSRLGTIEENVPTINRATYVNENTNTVTFTAIARYEGMQLDKSVQLQLRYPIYYGFGLNYEGVVLNVNKYDATVSSKHIYSKENGINNANFFILIPADIERPSGFKMGGAPFEMSMEQQTINNVTYYVYTSGAKYNTGASLQVEAY